MTTKAKWEQQGRYKVTDHAGCNISVGPNRKASKHIDPSHTFAFTVRQQGRPFKAMIWDSSLPETRDGNARRRLREVTEPGGWTTVTRSAESEEEAMRLALELAESMQTALRAAEAAIDAELARQEEEAEKAKKAAKRK